MSQDTSEPTTVIFDVKSDIIFDMPRLNAELEKRGEQGFFDKLSGTTQDVIERTINLHAEALNLMNPPIGEQHDISVEISAVLADGDKVTCRLTLSVNLSPNLIADVELMELLGNVSRLVMEHLVARLDDPFGDKKYAEAVSHLAGHLKVSDNAVRELYPDLDSVSKALDKYHAEYAIDTLQRVLDRLAPPPQKFGGFFEALFRR